MNGRCCCGCCSLVAGSSICLVIASVEAIIGIFISAELLLLMSESDVINPLHLVIDIDSIEDFDVFHGIVLAGLGLSGFWLAFALFAVSGNIALSHGRLTPWIFHTYLLSLFQFGVSIYFAIKFQSSFSETQQFYKESVPTKTLTYLTLLCIYSGGGVLIFFNLFLAHVVERRGKEIDKDYSALALYILSHMSRCNQFNDGMEQSLLPEAPPSYDSTCPPYLPPEIYRRATESSGSSWSLSYEAFKDISPEQPNTTSPVSNANRNVSGSNGGRSTMRF